MGAHYDTVPGSPGANDNGSAVAALLELSRLFKGQSTGRTLRFVAFANEEPPFFKTRSMGSFLYAEKCSKAKENIVGMLSLETIGYYREALEKFASEGKKAEQAQEDARYILPNATKTHLIWTTNLRNLLHVCHVRMCSRAQWEIRHLIHECRRAMEPKFPLIAKYMVVKCHPNAVGYCDEEFRSCGFRPLREDVISPVRDCPPGPGMDESG